MASVAAVGLNSNQTDIVTNPEWIKTNLLTETDDYDENKTIENVTSQSMSDAGGLSNEMRRIVIHLSSSSSSSSSSSTTLLSSSLRKSFVVKQTNPNGIDKSKSLGLVREVLFYQNYDSLVRRQQPHPNDDNDNIISSILPKVVYSSCCLKSGTKTIIMEDLTATAIQTGYFFGPHSILNRGKDLSSLTRECGPLSDDDEYHAVSKLTRSAFACAAALHASYWQRSDLLNVEWLRSSGWMRGEEKESWEMSQQHVFDCWQRYRSSMSFRVDEGDGNDDDVHDGWRWDPLVVSCVDAALRLATPEEDGWERFQGELKGRAYTLVHGDFHPGNVMVRRPSSSSSSLSLVVLDWEVVGVGSGPQDLGQFMISHTDPSIRERIEREEMQEYYSTLCRHDPGIASLMSFEECYGEYVNGGLGRWMWLLPLLASMVSDEGLKFFHDQVRGFIVSHGITPVTVPMPRA